MCLYREIADQLKELFLGYYEELPYAAGRIGPGGQYLGWVIQLPGLHLGLDLQDDHDRFLLFALASCWSRPGHWENSNYLIVDIKQNQIGCNNGDRRTIEYWQTPENINWEVEHRIIAAQRIYDEFGEESFRRHLSFRKDYYSSIHVLANNWIIISNSLTHCATTNDYLPFINLMRNVNGLAVAGGRMLIKIPLILRELRCQGIYDNIPGELCCVPDSRVINNARNILTAHDVIGPTWLSNRNGDPLDWLLGESKKIYCCFGDLYDLPLFAYSDLPNHNH